MKVNNLKDVTVSASRSNRFVKIVLGRCGENSAQRVIFDCAEFAAEYGAGKAVLYVVPPRGAMKYEPEGVEFAENKLTWTVSAADVAVAGNGACELSWCVDDVIAKTNIYLTRIEKSLDSEEQGTPPAAYEDFIKRIIAACTSVKSVNGKDGEVVLTAQDVGALPDDTVIPDGQDYTTLESRVAALENMPHTCAVESVNGKAGEVVLTAEDVGALPNSTIIPAAYDDTALAARVTALENKPCAVTSVNNKTGAVALTAADVGALPSDTQIPAAYDDTAISARVTALEDKAERFVVHCTASSISPFGGTFDIATDKSFNDILSAYNSNREVCATLTSSAMQGVAFLTGIAPDAAIFYTLITLGSRSNLMYLLVCISNDGPFGVLMPATYDDTDLSNRVSALETALTGLDEVIG